MLPIILILLSVASGCELISDQNEVVYRCPGCQSISLVIDISSNTTFDVIGMREAEYEAWKIGNPFIASLYAANITYVLKAGYQIPLYNENYYIIVIGSNLYIDLITLYEPTAWETTRDIAVITFLILFAITALLMITITILKAISISKHDSKVSLKGITQR